VLKTNLKNHFFILLTLTICLGFIGHFFYVNELIDHPQFNITTSYYLSFVGDLKTEIWYTLFFLIDFIWAPILLLFLYRILNLKIKNKKFVHPFLCLFIVTYVLDFIENICYLNFKFEALQIIKPIKEILYVLSFLSFLFVIVFKQIPILIKFVKNARISLLFIIIVSFLIGFVDQGGDILITLLESKYNLVVTLILLFVVAIPTAHYPVYFKHSKYVSSNVYELMISNKANFLSFGTIYFAKNKDAKKQGKESEKTTSQEIFLMQFLRRCLGVLFFISFFFMMLTAYDEAFSKRITTPITLSIAVFLFWFTWYFSKLKQKVDLSFKYKTYKKEENKKNVRHFTFIIKMIPFLVFFITAFIACFLIIDVNWSINFLFIVGFTNFLLAILYIISIVGRSYLKYVFYSEKYTKIFLVANSESYFNKDIKDKIRPSEIKIFSIFSQFSNNIVYLKLISTIGFLCVLSLIYLNLNWSIIHKVNPIPIFLMYYMAYYGILVIYIKHSKYYLQDKNKVQVANLKSINKYKKWWQYYIPGLLIIFILTGFYATFKGNDLHELQTLNRNKNEVTFTEYKESIKNKNKHYFAASYGGGLKSNLWTMLLLDKIEHNKNSDFFENVRCISTVSGGTVGTVNYLYLKANNIKNRSNKITQLGRLNSLSLDLVFLLGRDLLSELTPDVFYKFRGKDRSFYGMKQHLFTINNSIVDEKKTFYTSYYDVKNYFPPLIINSTSLNGRYANSLSLVLDKNKNQDYNAIFPGAINILGSKKNSELSLYRLASTSNRFPFVSPAAKIKMKGHFLDGGIFENSGLLSAHSFANYLLSKKIIKKNDTTKNIKFVNFINSKEQYILKFIEENNIFLDSINPTAEIAGILKAVSATRLNPIYIKETIEHKYDLIAIYLPHYFTFKDLKKVLGGFPNDKKENIKKILLMIKINNNIIKSVLDATDYNRKKWGIVQPATGRLLSKASVKYQKAMVGFHPNVIKQLKKLER
jgi:hypothetical protein